MLKPQSVPTAKKILANVGWLTLDRIIRMGGGLVVGTLVARYLGPSSFGLFNIAVAIYMLFNTVSSLGLDVLVVRDLVLHPGHHVEVLGTAFLLKALASVVTTLAAVLFAWIMHPAQPVLVVMVGILSVASISQAWDVIDYFFQAKTLSRRTVAPKLLVFVSMNLVRLFGIVHHRGLMFFVVSTGAEILLSELSLVVSYRLYAHGLSSWRISLPRGGSMLRESWPLLLATLLVMIYMRTDQILIGYFLGDRAVGYYSAAVRLSEVWYAVPFVIGNSAMPRLLQALTEDRDRYHRWLQTLYNLMVLLSVLLAVCTMPVSRCLVQRMFGVAYLPSAHVLNIHIWTGVFVFIGVLGGQQMVNERLVAIELRRALAGAVINLLLNLVLIPRYGIAGSAFATLGAQIVSSYASDALNRRTWHMFRMKSYALSGLWLLRGRAAWQLG